MKPQTVEMIFEQNTPWLFENLIVVNTDDRGPCLTPLMLSPQRAMP